MKLITKITAIFDRTLEAMAILAGILLAFAVLSVSVAVATRYFLGYPIGWVIEISTYILLYITFLVAAWVLREEGHVAVDILLLRLKPRTQSLLNTWYGLRVTWDLFQTNYFTPTDLELPKWIINIIIFIGSLFLSIQFLRRTYGYLGSWRAPQSKEQVPETRHEFDF
jgi:TRAP-type C4-dicarboxylate transport system permease small subunit